MVQLQSTEVIFKKFIERIAGLSPAQRNHVPAGFNNNPIWNFGHAVVSCYALAFIRPKVDEGYVIPYWEKYKIGSRPQEAVTEEEFKGLCAMALHFPETIRIAEAAGKFTTMVPFSTGTFGTEMNTLQEVLTTIFAHVTLHYGIASAQATVNTQHINY